MRIRRVFLPLLLLLLVPAEQALAQQPQAPRGRATLVGTDVTLHAGVTVGQNVGDGVEVMR